jgi:twitching motility protein PilJ
MVDQINAAKDSNGSSRLPLTSEDSLPIVTRLSPVPRASKAQTLGAQLRQMSLRTKATAIALAIGTLPVLGIGATAYYFADQAIKKEIITTQQAGAAGLSDKVNRFMAERYADIQVLSRLSILTNPKVKENTSNDEKQVVLNQFMEAYNSYQSIAILDLDGNVQFQTQGSKLPNQRDQAYFQSVLRGDSPYVERIVAPTITTDPAIYFAAPVRDSVSGKTIAIVRTAVSLQQLEDVIRDYQVSARDYFLIDSTGMFFISSQKNEVGRTAQKDFPGLEKLQAAKKAGTLVSTNQLDRAQQLVSYVPGVNLPGLPSLDWEVLLAADTHAAFAAQRGLLTTLAIGTFITALWVGILATTLARRVTRPILEATEAVEQLGQGALDTRVEVQGEDEIAVLSFNINQMADQLQNLLHQQTLSAQRSQILSQTVLNIRKSLSFDDILQTGVDEIRRLLTVDRVVIYRFNEDWLSGTVTAESVGPGWIRAMGKTINDPLKPGDIDRYHTGRIWFAEDIQNADLTRCHCEILERLEVRANMVAPVLRNGSLIALLCAHQCSSTRKWEPEEIDFFAQLATQIGFALDQAYSLEESQQARQQAEALSEERQQQKDELQRQLLNLLGDVEGAVMGDLTVRADVTVGEIGTVADFFNSIVESLRQIVTQVKQAAIQVNTSLESDEQSVRNLAAEAVQQAEETTLTLASMERMMRSIQEVSNSAHQAAEVSRTASQTAEEGGAAMDLTVQNILGLRETIGETAKKVKRLGESSQQISKVVSLINQIALQTNLLAINAGIEAARAGEESQGFAVVAEEVGELAARSAAATREIEQIVATIQRETSEVVDAMEEGTTQVVKGTRLVENAKQSLEQILTVSRQIDQLVRSISDATVSQVETSQAVTILMQDIVEVAGRTSDSSLQVSQSLRQTVEVAKELQDSVGTFKVN